MTDMIERVARAIATAEHQPEHELGDYASVARAAIAAMRVPTEEMIDAWARAPGAIKGGWQAMIDAALEGK